VVLEHERSILCGRCDRRAFRERHETEASRYGSSSGPLGRAAGGWPRSDPDLP